MRYETITTHDIRQGDTILMHGMVLLVDVEPRQTNHPVTEHGGETFAAAAHVVNYDEVSDGFIRSIIESDMSADGHRARNGRAPYDVPRWTIQGNGLARWARVIKEDN